MNNSSRFHSAVFVWSIVFFVALSITVVSPVSAGKEKRKQRPLDVPMLDAHNHILPYTGRNETDFMGGARAALKIMKEYGIKQVILMPHPFISSQRDSYTYKPLKKVAKKYPDRFMFLGGGGTLNIMLHDAVANGKVSPKMKEKFQKTAEKIISDGAIGFGEMVAEHFSMRPGHPYESSPPDHPLFLLLSDIAARLDVPIDIHMEAIPDEMDRPDNIPSTINPAKLTSNIEPFERLLSHNPKTRIIWAHAGWDNTGHRTTDLMGKLLGRHPNLYMSIKIRKKDRGGGGYNIPFDMGEIDDQWLALLEEYPDRFIIGSDQFYQPPQTRDKRRIVVQGSVKLLKDLPPELARRVGYENAARVFKID